MKMVSALSKNRSLLLLYGLAGFAMSSGKRHHTSRSDVL